MDEQQRGLEQWRQLVPVRRAAHDGRYRSDHQPHLHRQYESPGRADHQVRTNASLYCGNSASATFSGHTIKLNGGRWVLNSGNKGIVTSSDTVALESDSELRAGINNDDQQWILSGLIRDGFGGGTGKLSINTTNLLTGNQGRGLVDITGTNNTYSGGTLMVGNSNGYVRVFAPGGLGQGDVLVSAGARLILAASNTTASGKTIMVGNGGRLHLGVGGGSGVTFNSRGHNVLLRDGSSLWSELANSTANTVNSYDAYALEGSARFKNDTEGTFHIYGIITNGASAGKMVVEAPKLAGYALYLWNPSNTFSGGIDIQAGGYLSIATNGAYSTGPLTLLAATSYLYLDQTPNTDWTVTNTLAGKGTITVEAGAGANRLTAGGTVNPGIGGATVTTNTTGILTIAGAMGFASGSQLTIDIAGTNGVVGVDFDRLVVNYVLTNLNNATLYVNVATNLARNALVGQEFIVATNSTTLASTFGTVTGSGDGSGKIWTCTVVTNNPPRTVKLTNLYFRNPNAPIVNNANGATNVQATSAWLNGTLVDTGAAPASVSVYWGTNDGAFVKGAWQHTNDFGSCTNGQALTTNVTLTPATTYYYRFYATNTAGGDDWADLSTFTTPDTVPPEVTTNMGVTLIEKTTATLNGILTAGGTADATIYWGQNTNAWANTNSIGSVVQGVGFSANLSSLSPGTVYYYECYATNVNGEDYSEIASFTTKAPGLYTWKTDNGLWSAAANWDPTGGPPGLGDTGVLTGLVCKADANLTGGPTIEVRTNGSLYCGNGPNYTFTNHTIKLNGGRWVLNVGYKGIITNADTVALESDSEIKASGSDDMQWILSGLIRDGLGGGKGKLTLNTTGLNPGNLSRGLLDIAGTNNTYSGGTLLFSDTLTDRGPVRVLATGGLGLGDVEVSTYGFLLLQATNTTAAGRVITVGANGMLRIGTSATFNSYGHSIRLLNGSYFQSGGTAALNCYDSISVEGSVYVKKAAGTPAMTLYGAISNGASAGKIVIQAPGSSASRVNLANPGNSFSGGIDVEAAGRLGIVSNNAYGTGPITLLATNSYLTLDQAPDTDWTFTNTLAGCGTVTVEAGDGAKKLICTGTVDPGTNGTAITTNTTGILRVDGGMAFGAGSRLKIHIAGGGGVAGVDFDRLVVDHTLSGLSNAVLEVNVSPTLGNRALDGQELVIVSNAAPVASTFASVQWSEPWNGKVRYDEPSGTVKLVQVGTVRGSVLMVY